MTGEAAASPSRSERTVLRVDSEPVSTMTWDADGNRVSFTSSTGGTWQFVYDVTAGIPAVIEETGPVYYVREPNGALIVRLDGQYTNYYHFDALGSTRLLTDAYGTVTDAYTYDAWGGTSDQSGTTVQPYQFVGQLGYYFPIQDENFPLLHLGVRFYDPAETGRFTQVDPVGSGANMYEYAGGNPVTMVDPLGLKPEDFVHAAKRCATRCAVECLTNPFEPGNKCYDKCLLECLGPRFTRVRCKQLYCILFPTSRLCRQAGQLDNPCDRDQASYTWCQECCDVKYWCCLLFNKPGGQTGCETEQKDCKSACNMSCTEE